MKDKNDMTSKYANASKKATEDVMAAFGGPPRDPSRITEIADLVVKIWSTYSDLRFFQFLLFLSSTIKKRTGREDLFSMEDDCTVKILKDILANREGSI